MWSLCNSSVISCFRVRGGVGKLVPNGIVQDNISMITHSMSRAHHRCTSSLSKLSPFSWRISDHNAQERPHSLKNVFCLRAETYFIDSCERKVVSSALSKHEHDYWMKVEPATGIQRVLFSKSPQGGAEKPEPDEKQNKTKQLKKIFKEYGAIGVSFHIGISLISLGIFYIAVSSGIDMTHLLCKLGFSESFVQSKVAAGTSTFVLAYAVHKLFAPFRISITLVSVPFIVRYLRKTGLFKSSSPRL